MMTKEQDKLAEAIKELSATLDADKCMGGGYDEINECFKAAKQYHKLKPLLDKLAKEVYKDETDRDDLVCIAHEFADIMQKEGE